MKKILLLAGLLIVVAVAVVVFYGYNRTKSFSPESSASFVAGDLKIDVFYNRPYKKGRIIFGGLVPYGKTWRTGANEATVFETSKNILVGGKELKKGKGEFSYKLF